MKNILTVKHIAYFVLFGVFLLLNTSLFAAFACQSPKVQCCNGGKRSCCDPLPCTSTPCQEYNISCWNFDNPIIEPDIIEDDPYIPTSCTEGKKKYTAQVNGCETKEETCCSGEWCSKSCKSCTDTSGTKSCSGNIDHATGGTLTLTRSVKSSCGSCSYTAWVSSGSCTCANGYEWKNGQCQSTATPEKYTWTCSWNTTWGSQTNVTACPTNNAQGPEAMPEGVSCTPKGQYCQSRVYAPGITFDSDYVPFRCWCN